MEIVEDGEVDNNNDEERVRSSVIIKSRITKFLKESVAEDGIDEV